MNLKKLSTSSSSSHSIAYRPDIDGLRALAILPVVLFHAFPQLLPGGFIGVDIFFVISGYLITSILLKDIQQGRYSINHFYARRVRRIFPALSIVLLFCLALGWIVLTAVEYRSLGKHAAGGAGFVANIMFWKEAGYFDAAGDTKPLLHLWSLGIEEQFYIVWPLLIYFVYKRSWNILLIIVGVATLSFGLNVVRIGVDPIGSFYSPLSRAWELALGALLAHQAISPNLSWKAVIEKYSSSISIVGFLFIVLGFFVIHEGRAFPGWWALLPAVGSALLIAAGPSTWMNRMVLSRSWMVWIGLISFPLYLWHWPLLSFARIIYSEHPPVDVRVVLVVASIVLATLTYWFIEKPIRNSGQRKSLIWFISIFMLLIFIAGAIVYKTKGVKSRHAGMLNADPSSLTMGADRGRWSTDCGIPLEAKSILKSCYSPKDEKATYAVWGDSKGEAIFYGLAREAVNQDEPRWMMIGNVIPMLGDIPRLRGRNATKNQYVVDALLANKNLKAVLFAPAARSIFSLSEVYTKQDLDSSPLFDEGIEGIGNAINILEKAGKRVIFLVDHPGFPDPKSCISGGLTKSDLLNQFLYRKENPLCKMTYEQHLRINERYKLFVETLQKNHPRLIVYDPTHLICDISKNECGIARDGKFLYSYGDHYSDYGNTLVARDFLNKLPRLLKQ
jgi:peptidoglycan/LPS O-acetylase OafA/YrhL